MALDYVKAGETVKASTVNSLVDAALGTQTPSPDLVYTTTPHGTQMSLPSNYGGPNGPLVHYLDTEMYVLSGWQFVKLALGHELDDCLEVFKLHTADGEVANPVSAAVVFQNSAASPTTDVLSGYLLSDECFGLDRAAGSAGWVQTLIEYTNGQVPAKAELWSWKKPSEMAAVFTNVEDQLSVKNMLSSILEDGGVDGEQLSSLERIGSWPLTYATSLSVMRDGQVKWVPTHQLVRVHDDIDVWDSEEAKTHHVNSASIVCYNIEEHQDSQTGKRVIDNAKFAWKYWLGPDSEYEEGESISFVYSHSWTINGQPAVIKVDEEIDELTAYDGSDVAIQDERGGYSILHGEFELNPEDGEQGQIDAGSLFVNFNYYDTYAAMIGELGGANYSTVDDLSKSVLLAKQKEPFTVDEDELSLGDEIPRRLLIYGTYSAVDKDWPLPDTTCPEYDGEHQKTKKSLEWKDNKPEDGHTEPVDDTGVKSLQIYRFSEVIKSQCDRLSDLQLSDQVVFLARRQDKDGGAFVDYINLDDLSSLVDSKCETLYLSSIQEKTYTFTDDQGMSHSLLYHQLYGFDGAGERLDPDNIDKYEIVVRKSQNPGAIVSYVPLSSVLSSSGVFTDTQISETSSIQFDDDGNGPYLELFKFNDGDYGDTLALHELGDREIVVRDGDHVNYITLSGDALSDIIPDATIQDGQKSIDWLTNAHDRVIQLYKFDQPGMVTIPQTDVIANGNAESLIPEEYEFVVRKNGPGGEIEYMQAKLSVQHEDLSVDSEGVTGQKSIAFLGDSKELQLYKFNQGGQGTTSALVPTYWEDPAKVLPSNYEFIVRKGGAGGEVEYKKLELKQAQLSVDRQGHPNQKSLQYCDLGDGAFLELDHFHSNGMTLPKVSLTSADVSLLPNNHEFLIRKKVGGFWQIDYAPLSACVEGALSATVSVDTDVVRSQRSIEWAEDNNEEYLQLYNFDAGSIRVDPSDWASYDLVIRDFKTINGSIVNYTNLSSLASSMVSVVVDNAVELLSGLSCEPDAKYPQLCLSSIQDDDFVDPKTGLKYHQLFNFQKPAIDADLSDVASYDIVIRDRKTNPNGSIVNYTSLSALPLSASNVIVSSNSEVVINLLDALSALSCEPDAKYPQLHLSSIQDDDFVDPKTGLKYHQLFNFQNEGIDIPPSDMSAFEFVVRDSKTDPTGKIVNYAKLSSLLSSLGIMSCDTEKVVTRKSLDLVLSGENTPYYQLHNFQTSADNGPDTWLKFQDQPLSGEDFGIGCQTQFVVRVPNGNNEYEVKYMQLSAYQEHERVDTCTWQPRGRSVDYTAYDEGYGCYQVLQLYGFDWGCSHFITSADISSDYGNGILIRKWDSYGCCWQLDYMGFDSLDELAIKYIGDTQLSLSAHRPYQRSAEVFYDQADQKKYVQLYGFDTDIDNASVTIHNDGCTYYWPQDIRTDQQLYEWDYILVKHIDSSGNITLQYKQLEVTMPDIDSIQGDINNIYGEINNFYDEINYLSGCIDDLSGHLSGSYWESGGYTDTCYGHSIGDGNGCIAIDLDYHNWYGDWWCFGCVGGNSLQIEGLGTIGALQIDHLGQGCGITFYGGCTYIYNSNSYFDGTVGVGCQLNIGCTWINGGGAYVDGSMTVNSGCAFQVGCSYLDQSTMQVGCSIRIGNTSLNEAQLSALLQLVNAPQMLQNL